MRRKFSCVQYLMRSYSTIFSIFLSVIIFPIPYTSNIDGLLTEQNFVKIIQSIVLFIFELNASVQVLIICHTVQKNNVIVTEHIV